jgi:Ca-activated chloride channel homolog
MKLIPMKLRIALFSVAVPVVWASLLVGAGSSVSAQTTAGPKGDTPPVAQAASQTSGSSSQQTPPQTGSQASPQSSPPTSGQQPATPPNSGSANSQPDEPLTTITTVTNEVRVVFTVTDKHGHYIKDLKKDDFKVIDDKKPAALRSFRSETDLPLEVGLLIDASNSVRDRFKFEQEAAIEFLNATIRPHYDEAFVVGFDVTPEVVQDFTDNSESLSIGVRSLRAGGGTAMYDALYFACRDKLLKHEQTRQVRRAIILLSDGEDNQSHVTREEAIEMAERADAIVYTISTNISGMKGAGDKTLERIADATGGRAFFPFQMREVSDAFSSIQEELRSQYLMAYKPENFVSDGRYRTIDIEAPGKGFKVRTRKGYYAPKQ